MDKFDRLISELSDSGKLDAMLNRKESGIRNRGAMLESDSTSKRLIGEILNELPLKRQSSSAHVAYAMRKRVCKRHVLTRWNYSDTKRSNETLNSRFMEREIVYTGRSPAPFPKTMMEAGYTPETQPVATNHVTMEAYTASVLANV